jgi:hypothetical protein
MKGIIAPFLLRKTQESINKKIVVKGFPHHDRSTLSQQAPLPAPRSHHFVSANFYTLEAPT